jgi:hypothetical protein
MSGRKTREETENRLADVRRLLRERHAQVEPDAHFAERVMASLPRDAGWSIAWAARWVLPVSAACTMALTIAVVATGRSATGRTAASPSVSATSQSGGDLLEWLLEGREERR